MCFDLDSRPPISPIEGGAADSAEMVLQAADGNRYTAFSARAAKPTGAGMIVLPDVRGLHAYYEDLALRFAEIGVDAVAIDYFGRTAGLGRRGPDFDNSEHVPQTTIDGLTADITAAAQYLRSPEGGSVEKLFTVGFCFGGRLSFLTPTMGLGLAGSIGFYGWPVGPHRSGMPAPAEAAAQMKNPILAMFGGADQGIPTSAAHDFERALENAGVEHRVVIYPGAPHSFFDRKADEFARTSAEAWAEVRRFIEVHSSGAAPA
jgi:carboxymethylenebutenolidase